MKHKQKIEFIIAMILVITGAILLILPVLGIDNLKIIIPTVFGIYSVVSIIKFILTRENKDYEGMFTFIVSLIAMALCIYFKVQDYPQKLAMTLMFWITCMSIIKLKKIDYYHDRRDRMWKLRVLILGLFILIGILTAINLAYSSEVQLIVLGFFLFTHAVLEIFDPIVKTLVSHG